VKTSRRPAHSSGSSISQAMSVPKTNGFELGYFQFDERDRSVWKVEISVRRVNSKAPRQKVSIEVAYRDGGTVTHRTTADVVFRCD
jgi:hypothetical protein